MQSIEQPTHCKKFRVCNLVYLEVGTLETLANIFNCVFCLFNELIRDITKSKTISFSSFVLV